MRHRHLVSKPLVVTAVVAAVVLLPSCRRAPEDEATAPAKPTAEGEVELITTELPQTNPTIGVTVEAVPDGLVVTFNGDNWIELTEVAQPNIYYTFVANSEKAPTVAPTTMADFETSVLAYADGRMTGAGTVDTALGEGVWASGTYSEDSEFLEKIYILAPHPSGTGNLIMTSVCPQQVASVSRRLDRIRQIIANVR
jgi:hypothetical protein